MFKKLYLFAILLFCLNPLQGALRRLSCFTKVPTPNLLKQIEQLPKIHNPSLYVKTISSGVNKYHQNYQKNNTFNKKPLCVAGTVVSTACLAYATKKYYQDSKLSKIDYDQLIKKLESSNQEDAADSASRYLNT